MATLLSLEEDIQMEELLRIEVTLLLERHFVDAVLTVPASPSCEL